MAALGLPLQLTEVDGVPCFWADAPGPCTAGLLFRVGRADEQLAAAGITRLAARGGLVDHATTAFYFTGTPDEVAAGLEAACAALHGNPPDVGDLAPSQRAEPSTVDRMLMMRFGATGFGLGFYEELGLRRLTPEDAASWARERFTSANAALWITAPPPAGLRLPLPPGARMPAPPTEPLPGLQLPAFTASGEDGIASTIVTERSMAMTVAGRAIADRTRALGYTVDAWQFPLSGTLAHRYLAVECSADEAPRVLDQVIANYEAIAAEGPTSAELDAARGAIVGALADDDSVPGALEQLAVDELLGAPRQWKEDVAAAAESVSYADAAAAVRSGLATQIVLAPVSTPMPTSRPLADFPWFSGGRIKGMELRPDRRHRGSDARLVVSQEGVSHVAGDRASTVRFADVVAALQEADGSLTLIARDGAIVPIDPSFFKGAGSIVSDLERRLPPTVILPPRDASGSGLEQLARRKLRPRWNIDRHLQLLRTALDHDEQPVTLCEAVLGVKAGLLAVTERRVIWVGFDDRSELVRDFPYGGLAGATTTRFPSAIVTLRSHSGDTAFSRIQPKERAGEVAEEVQRRVTAAHAVGSPPGA
jgi:hypothetical protein